MTTIHVNKETYVGLFVALVAAFLFLFLVNSASGSVPTLTDCGESEVLAHNGTEWNCARVSDLLEQ